jgi:hypothetical protein
MPGFQPKFPDNWKLGNFSEGCERLSPLCSNDVVQNFLELKSMKAGKPDAEPDYSDENDCMNKCLSKCNCQAYSYHSSICLQLVSDNVVKLGSEQVRF